MTATMERYNRELTLDELENVCGGAAEAQDNAIIETLVVAGLTLAAKIIIKTILPDTFDEFYAIVKKNPAAVQAGIMAAAGVPGIIAYNCLSSGAQKNLWRNVYSALK